MRTLGPLDLASGSIVKVPIEQKNLELKSQIDVLNKNLDRLKRRIDVRNTVIKELTGPLDAIR